MKELGGKDSKYLNNMDVFLQSFEEIIGKNKQDEDLFYSSGIIYESDIAAPSFTAMGMAILCRKSIIDKVSLWSFAEKEFVPMESISASQTCTLEASQCAAAHHARFRGTKSRKGYFQVRLKICGQSLDLVFPFQQYKLINLD
jgi:hypothetical protein